jgi:general secretion pathway protein K
MALLAIVSLSLTSTGSISYRLARGSLEIANADAIAEAGVNRTFLGLRDARPESQWHADGLTRRVVLDGVEMGISIQDELGLIDLNAAGPDLLSGLLRSSGAEPQTASAIVANITEWRDANLRVQQDAAQTSYRSADRPFMPRHGAFQSLDELKLVMGMTPELFGRMAPALTIYSARPIFDPQSAPRQALLALPNSDGTKVEAMINARSRKQFVGHNDLYGRAFSVRLEFDSRSVHYIYETVIRITADPDRPYWVLRWKKG